MMNLLTWLIIRAPPEPMVFPRVISRPLRGQHEPTTAPRGKGPRMGESS